MPVAKRLTALMLCIFFCAAFCGCANGGERAVRFDGDDGAYIAAVMDALPEDYENAGEYGAVSRLRSGEAAGVKGVAAEYMLRLGCAEHWYPLIKETPVVAVDRDLTDAEITGWGDLRSSGLRVRVSRSDRGLLLAAMAYGLEGGDFTLKSAAELLEQVCRAGKLTNEDDAPLTVCFDWQAAQLRLGGRNIEIVVPAEGTLSFERGLVSTDALTLEDGVWRRLADGGYRTVRGDCDRSLYPDEAEYARANEPEDCERLLLEMQDQERLMRRRVERTRLYSSADQREHISFAVAFLILVVFWICSVIKRTARGEIRFIAILTGLMLNCWVMLRCVKYQLVGADVLERLCWYGYYIFIIGLPLCLLALALIVDRSVPGRGAAAALAALVMTGLALIVLVLTNDAHMLVFRFERGGDWNDYSYGIGYYFIMFFCVGVLIGAVVILTKKTGSSPRRYGMVFPMLFMLLMIGYGVGYALGVPLMRDSDLTMTLCVFGALFFESAMLSGLIPNNTRYNRLFARSPLNMRLLDAQGVTVLAAAGSEPVPDRLLRRLAPGGESAVMDGEDTALYADRITGGTVVWQEDRSSINRLHEELRGARQQLVRANAILAREEQSRRTAFGEEERSRLFERMEREISDRLDELSELIRTLPDARERRRRITEIMLLLCYVKRRCNMYFIGCEKPERQEMPCSDLGVYLDELAELAACSGVRCAVNFPLRGTIALQKAILIYDFVCDSLRWGTRCGVRAMLETLSRTDGEICLGVTVTGALGLELISDGTWELLERLGASVELIDQEDCSGLRLIIPERGAGDA